MDLVIWALLTHHKGLADNESNTMWNLGVHKVGIPLATSQRGADKRLPRKEQYGRSSNLKTWPIFELHTKKACLSFSKMSWGMGYIGRPYQTSSSASKSSFFWALMCRQIWCGSWVQWWNISHVLLKLWPSCTINLDIPFISSYMFLLSSFHMVVTLKRPRFLDIL